MRFEHCERDGIISCRMSSDLLQLISTQTLLLLLAVIWSLFWKGMALWRAAKQDQRNWFVALLVVNTLGILEILYLVFFAKKKA